MNSARFLLHVFVTSQLVFGVHGWGSSSSTDSTVFAESFKRDWLYDATAISMKLEGCVWGYVSDSEEAGCLKSSSSDGTYYWYQMANCRRAQAAFSLYTSDSSNSVSCNSNTYRETFVTKVGLSEFIGYLKTYDPNSPFADGGGDEWNANSLPVCQQSNQGYLGVGCASDGTFTIQIFQDAYCLSSIGTYNTLSSINSNLKNYKDCVGVSSGNGGDNSFAKKVIPYTESCSSLDSPLCSDDSAMSTRRSSASRRSHTGSSISHQKSWGTKLKYVAGAFLLISSFVMFTGILFTNRRRRRALIQRKYRQTSRSSRGEDKARKSGSRSKSRDASKRSRSSKSKRSKSRTRTEGEGVFT